MFFAAGFGKAFGALDQIVAGGRKMIAAIRSKHG